MSTETKRSGKKAAIIAVIAVVVVIALILLLWKVILPNQRYSAAEKLLSEGKYEEAVSAFTGLGDFRDASDRVTEIRMAQGEAFLDSGDYDQAVRMFTEAGSDQRVKAAKTAKAASLAAEGKFDEAIEAREHGVNQFLCISVLHLFSFFR